MNVRDSVMRNISVAMSLISWSIYLMKNIQEFFLQEVLIEINILASKDSC